MISGKVDSELEPHVPLALMGADGLAVSLPFVLDTGYNRELSLPRKLIERLGLEWVQVREAELADGSHIEHRVFRGKVLWDGEWREVEIDEADSVPLLGTLLLRGYELKAEMRPRGDVSLKKLPPRKRKTRT